MIQLKDNPNGIRFKEDVHKYYNKDDKRYISGTQFIHLFVNKFNGEFWSKFKSYEPYFDSIKLEEQSELYNEYVSLRNQAGWRPKKGATLWDYVKTKNMKYDDFESIFIDCDKLCKDYSIEFDLKSSIEEINKDWKKTNKQSTDKGTELHNAEENKTRKEFGFTDDWNMKELTDLYPATYPEMILFNHDYEIAGTADKVIIKGEKRAAIHDYKTNKELKFDSFTNPFTGKKPMMKYPFDNFPDCNMSHYAVQLNLYSWMLEQFGYKVHEIVIIYLQQYQLDGKKLTKKVEYPIVYNPKMIVKALEYYKNEIRPTLKLK